MNILSIQSHVAFGHVGNASAVFPMQRLGVEVWPIHTVQFSNHTGYGAWKGRVFDGPMIDEVMDGIADRGALAHCDGVISGYMGSSDIGAAILSAVGRGVPVPTPLIRYRQHPAQHDDRIEVRKNDPAHDLRMAGAQVKRRLFEALVKTAQASKNNQCCDGCYEG